MRQDCPSCGSNWYLPHKADCTEAARKFLSELASEKYWTSSEDFPRCPKCGHGTDDWRDFMPRYGGDGDKMHVTCAHCEQDYAAEIVISYSFRIKPIVSA